MWMEIASSWFASLMKKKRKSSLEATVQSHMKNDSLLYYICIFQSVYAAIFKPTNKLDREIWLLFWE
jgi:hypothetical protein